MEAKKKARNSKIRELKKRIKETVEAWNTMVDSQNAEACNRLYLQYWADRKELEKLTKII